MLQAKNCNNCDKQILAASVVRVLTHLLSESAVCKVQLFSAFVGTASSEFAQSPEQSTLTWQLIAAIDSVRRASTQNCFST